MAQFYLGSFYEKGMGVPQDYDRALKWYMEAAANGTERSMLRLALAYEEGNGVPQDFIQAHKWYNLAASRYQPGEDRDRSAKWRDDIAARMTPAQIAEALRLAREWKPKKEGK